MLLCYIAYIDFRSFKIPNRLLLLLLLLYGLNSVAARSWVDVLVDALFAALVFAIALCFYVKGVIGGGDVKLLAIACLWVGTRCAMPFCLALLFFVLIHLAALRIGRLHFRPAAGHRIIPYAPSIAGAFFATILLGC